MICKLVKILNKIFRLKKKCDFRVSHCKHTKNIYLIDTFNKIF